MQAPTTTLASALLVATTLALPATAQELTLAPFAALDRGLDPAPRTVGLAATLWGGAAGFRLGAAMDVESSPVAPLLGYPPSEATRAWSADADLVLSGGRMGLAIGGVRPSVFVGFGAHGRRRSDGSTVTIPTWSYGVGVSVPLMSRLSADAEARYRMPHESDARLIPPDAGGGVEVRAGLALHLGGPGSIGRRPRPEPPAAIRMGGVRPARPADGVGSGAASAGSRSASADALARDVLDTAGDYDGVRYTWGGNTPREGFDCSGFVKYVFDRHGIHLPRVSRDQRWAGRAVQPQVSALLPGDLMFYAGSDGVVNHVAIYAGGNRIIHSSSSGRGVRWDDLSTRRGRYYATRMVAARRVIPDGGTFRLW